VPLKDKGKKRQSGVLLPISALPSAYGIGSLGQAAYRFVDFLNLSGQHFWQILPLNPLGEGNSPYKSSSAFAGEILYIDIDFLTRDGLLDVCDVPKCKFPQKIDYDDVRNVKIQLIKRAAKKLGRHRKNYLKFLNENNFWLEDYAVFETALELCKAKSIRNLPDGIKYRVPAEIEKFKSDYKDEIEFHKVAQYFFFCQYYDLKRYANAKGVKIIGDIPFYVSPDSADVWTRPDDFKIGRDFTPVMVAGVPPDIFSKEGQLWGNPIYNWQNMKGNDYHWWQIRLKLCRDMYDVVRIDHFRAFANYYQIPFGSKNALAGSWIAGEGKTFWDKMKEAIGEIDVIAEDLGGEDERDVIELLKQTGFPNMKILQFAFNGDSKNIYLPQNYPYNCVCYTGTHDNDTALGWYKKAPKKQQAFFDSVIKEEGYTISQSMLRALSKSCAMLCVIPMQDVLELDSSARINTPGTMGDNWQWRLSKDDINDKNAKMLKALTKERN